MRYLLLLLIPSIALAQTPTPTPDPEGELANSLNVSRFEIRASRTIQVLQQLIELKKAEREGRIGPISELTQGQKAGLRQRRLQIRGELGALCDAVRESE